MLAEALSAELLFDGNLITAGDDGIHWKAIQQAVNLIKYAIRTVLPASDSGGGRNFAISPEGANVVAEVFRQGP